LLNPERLKENWPQDLLTHRERGQSSMDMKELITYIAKALVDNPEAVEVSEVEGEQTSVIELKVAKSDLGKVIGKQGRTARAMRTILSAASTKIRKRAVLEIIE
jgi:uncharacterized protein